MATPSCAPASPQPTCSGSTAVNGETPPAPIETENSGTGSAPGQSGKPDQGDPTQGNPTQGDPAQGNAPTGAWSDAWEQKFRGLGLTDGQLDTLKSANMSDSQLQRYADEVKSNPAAVANLIPLVKAGMVPGENSSSVPPGAPGSPDGTTPGQAPGQAPGQTGMPANQMSTWPEWAAVLRRLGVDEANIQRIGNERLTEPQLAEVYRSIEQELGKTGKPGDPNTPPVGTQPDQGPVQSAWSPQWEAAFRKLNLNDKEIAEVKAIVEQNGLPEEGIKALYEQVKAQQPGWNKQWEDRFRKLGMPPKMIEIYKKSGAPASGLEAAFKYAEQRANEFRKSGWYDKLKKQKINDDQLWQLILADKKPTTKNLQELENKLRRDNSSGLKKGLQLGMSFVPGVELAQYVAGRKALTGETIDKKSGWNIAFAALSGITAFSALRGIANLGKGAMTLKALNAGGITKGGQAMGLQGAKLGALESAGTLGKLKIYGKAATPFTRTQRQLMALGHMEKTAFRFQNGGKAAMMQSGRGLEAAALEKSIAQVKSGQKVAMGDFMGFLPKVRGLPFRTRGPMVQMQQGKPTLAQSIKAWLTKTEPAAAPDVFRFSKTMGPGTSADGLVANFGHAAGQNLTHSSGALVGGTAQANFGKLAGDQIDRLPREFMGRTAEALKMKPADGVRGMRGALWPGAHEDALSAMRSVSGKTPAWYATLGAKGYDNVADAAKASAAIAGGTGVASTAAARMAGTVVGPQAARAGVVSTTTAAPVNRAVGAGGSTPTRRTAAAGTVTPTGTGSAATGTASTRSTAVPATTVSTATPGTTVSTHAPRGGSSAATARDDANRLIDNPQR